MRRRRGPGNRRGQGLTEYIIVVALVAIAAIGVVNYFGQQLREQFSTMVAAMAGDKYSVTSHAAAAKKEANRKTLSTYAGDASNSD